MKKPQTPTTTLRSVKKDKAAAKEAPTSSVATTESTVKPIMSSLVPSSSAAHEPATQPKRDRDFSFGEWFDELLRRHERFIPLVLLLICAASRFYRLDQPNGMCWSECVLVLSEITTLFTVLLDFFATVPVAFPQVSSLMRHTLDASRISTMHIRICLTCM